jgi:threonine dehydratase
MVHMSKNDTDPVKATLLANVYDVAIESPLETAQKLSKQKGCKILLKREDLQPVHSFKLRGAYNKISQLSKAELERGIVAASAGNHAQGVALSANILKIPATIVMPHTTPAIKVDAVKSHGAKVVLHGDSYSDAYEYSMELVAQKGRTFVHPFDDPLVIAGQGTIGRELLEQNPRITHIFVPVGGGGLISGIAQYIKAIRPNIEIIGVEPEDSCAMKLSIEANKIVELPSVGIFADGVAVKKVGNNTFKLCKKYVDDFVTVTNDEICTAIEAIFEETRSIVEPAGSLSVAAIKKANLPKDAVAVAICSGANMPFERLQYIAERTLLGSDKEALYSVRIPEKSGSALAFYKSVVSGHSVTEFNYRLDKRSEANIFIGLGISNSSDKEKIEQKMHKNGYPFVDLTKNDVAKEHIRHMIGGKSHGSADEQVYSINFPERPGALGEFLGVLSDRYNISLFHYRGQGGDVGRALIAFETSDAEGLESILVASGLEYTKINDNPAIKLFT